MTKDRRVDKQLAMYRGLDKQELIRSEASGRERLADNLTRNRLPQALAGIAIIAAKSLSAGQSDVVNGDPNGWRLVERFCRLRERETRVSGVRALGGPPLPAALLFLEWLDGPAYDATTASLEKYLLEHPAEHADRTLAIFAVFCQRQLQTRETLVVLPPGPLKDLVDAIDQPELAPGLLEAACEFQLGNFGLREKDGTEFVLFSLLPVWWHGLAKVRSAKNLTTPRPDHALFSTPLATFPTEPTGYRLEDDEFFPIIADIEQRMAP